MPVAIQDRSGAAWVRLSEIMSTSFCHRFRPGPSSPRLDRPAHGG